MSSFSTGATSEAGKAVALAVVLSALIAYVPVLGAVLMPVLPMPAAYVTFRRGVVVGVAAAFGAGVLSAALTGLGNGLLTFLLSALVGVVVGWALARRLGFSATLLATTVGGAVAFAVSTVAAWVLAGLDRTQIVKLVDDSLAAASRLYSSMGVDPAVIESASRQIREWLDIVPYLLPSILGVAGLIMASATLALVAVVFPHLGEKAASGLAFSRFRLHWSASYGFIVGLGLMALGPALGAWAEAARLIGLNFFMFFETLFFIQGLSVAHWFVVTRRHGAGVRIAVYGGAVLGQLLLQITSWAGLLDTWFDYRKRFAPRAPKAGSAGPAGSRGTGDQEES
ncbi:MAG TPA: DUF2232 domain-containing protein [Thermoleophilia bacterium]|nr:DUF2232 domain-containing protein [Thermoleophilia bacterium]